MYKLKIITTSFSLMSLKKQLNNIKIISQFLFRKKSNIITLLKSPHVHKKSRIQYQFKYYKNIIIYKNKYFNNILYYFKYLQKYNNNNIKTYIKIIK